MEGLTPLTRVAGPYTDISAHGVIGDGITDRRTAIQAILDSVPDSGGTIYFPTGSYLVSGSLRPKSNTVLCGDGYGSQIKCPSAGWLLGAVTNYGIINIDNKSNVRITNLRITGTKSADINNTPKLIYLEGTLAAPLENVKIDHNDLENTAFEGIWMGGSQTYTTRIFVESNYIKNVGYPAGAFVGLPAIQLNCNYGIAANNILEDVGNGIGASGSRLTISGNVIRGITASGIQTGDNVDTGLIDIIGNLVEFNERVTGSARRGIASSGGSGTDFLVNITGNTVRAVGTSGIGDSLCYYVETSRNANFSANLAEIQVRGVGFSSVGSSAGTNVSYKANTVRVVSESGASLAFVAKPNGSGNTINVISENNRVYGLTRAQGSYAYDYNTQGGGTLDVKLSGDYTPEGNVRIGDVSFSSGELSLDNRFIFDSNDPAASPHYLRSPKIGMLNFQSARDLTIATGVIDISGTVASLYKRRTLIRIDTESAAATDDLDTVNGGQDGDILILSSAVDGRDPTIKHNTGNVWCNSDFTLTTTKDRIILLYDGGLSKWVELSRWSPTLNVATAYQIAGTQVVQARETGWTAGTGTANKGAFATYAGQDVSATYTESEVQAIDDAVKAATQRIKALEDMCRTHGLIN